MEEEILYRSDEEILMDWLHTHYYSFRYGDGPIDQKNNPQKIAQVILNGEQSPRQESRVHGILTEILAAQVLQKFTPDFIIQKSSNNLDLQGCDLTVRKCQEGPIIGAIDVTSSLKSYSRKNMYVRSINDIDVTTLWIDDIGQLQLKRKLRQNNTICLEEFVTDQLLNGDTMPAISTVYLQIRNLLNSGNISSESFREFLESFYYNFQIVDFYSWGYPNAV